MTRAIVIGSGAGGSFAAMVLAQAGWQVTLFPTTSPTSKAKARSAPVSATTAWP
jgi:2-polyprenyl-6-methoxyphenol hydroxylase-like FAD-dependent oxidoreductase